MNNTADYKIGIRVIITCTDENRDVYQHNGKLGTIVELDLIADDGIPYKVDIDGATGQDWARQEDITPLNVGEVTLFGSRVQLKAFMTEALEAGARMYGQQQSTAPIHDNQQLIIIYNPAHKTLVRIANPDTTGEVMAINVLKVWETMLEYIAKAVHAAPSTISGYDVELHDGVLHIGCKRIPVATAIKLAEVLRELRQADAPVTSNLFLGGYNIKESEVEVLAQWLESKNKINRL